jgi:limonene-1,2-epoxide hydrolase
MRMGELSSRLTIEMPEIVTEGLLRSVLTITDRKVTHWRDYLDPVAVFDALGWPSR